MQLSNMLKSAQSIKLADGETYFMSLIDLDVAAMIEERWGFSITDGEVGNPTLKNGEPNPGYKPSGFSRLLEILGRVKPVEYAFLLYTFLQLHHPGLSEVNVRKLVTFNEIQDMFLKINIQVANSMPIPEQEKKARIAALLALADVPSGIGSLSSPDSLKTSDGLLVTSDV